jgi:hypothetical protein
MTAPRRGRKVPLTPARVARLLEGERALLARLEADAEAARTRIAALEATQRRLS